MSWRAELGAGVELWLVPALLALLPWRAGMLLARCVARMLPLYGEAARASAAPRGRASRGSSPPP